MQMIVAVDGGGSKTLSVLVDETGRVLKKLIAGCTNHQICGIEKASATLCGAVDELLRDAGAQNGDVAHLCIGLSGMDFDRDIALMERHLSGKAKELDHVILNDIWIAMSAGGFADYSAVSVCGTGHNTGVVAKDGSRYGISALRYTLGNFGGGMMLANEALHNAFRSFEKTGEYTALEAHLPALCEAADMQDLLYKIYESDYTYHLPYAVPLLVDTLARDGDSVCRGILEHFGQVQGEMTGRLIRCAGLEEERVPVVLAGSLYVKRLTDYMTDAFGRSLREYCREPVLQPLSRPPVLGAAMLAMRRLHRDMGLSAAEKLLTTMDETIDKVPEKAVDE